MLHLYDSLSREIKPFPPSPEGPVTVYSCGPTVYHYAHIGNLRTFLTVDILRRYLEYKGREVRLVMNITDVGHMLNDADVGDDKMEAAAAKEGKTPEEIADFYEKAFFDDLERLRFKKDGTTFPRATANIPQMIALIEKLLSEDRAYVTPKGDIYYSVASFPGYGKLSGNTVENLVAGARVDVKEDKRHPADFALWINNPNHVMQWKGPRGIQGYPGWHIECSAMAQRYLGETIDLHCGGEDLRFPHHECEIAQSEGASGVPFARHWLHVTYLFVDGQKMSKSKGNFYTLEDLLKKGFSASVIRWLLVSSHYRTQLNFTLEGLEAVEKNLAYFREAYGILKMQRHKTTVESGKMLERIQEARKSFDAALDDDLNVSEAFAVIHKLVTKLNKGRDAVDLQVAEASSKFLEEALDGVFGIDLMAKAESAPEEVKQLAADRYNARLQKRWSDSDKLRDEIASKGWIVEDTPQGQRLKKA